MEDGQTQQQRLAAYLEHARGEYADDLIRDLEARAASVDARVAALGAEERASYQDTMDLLSTALAEKFPAPTDSDGYSYWGYVVDFGDDWAVFCQKGVKYQVSYSLDGSSVTLGDKTPVREVTTYVPVQSNSENATGVTVRERDVAEAVAGAARNFATAKRAMSSYVEHAPARSMELQIRMGGEGQDANIANFDGYAYTINERYGVSDWLGVYEERIGPGASSKTLREQIVPMLVNHDGVPIASTGSKTSELADDGKGLRNRARLDRRQGITNDICIALERGDVTKMSFSFRAVQEDWNDSYDDRLVRELQLYDTSIVTYPANPNTTAELVESFRSAMGREGRSLWLADSEMSVRSALPVIVERSGDVAEDEGDLLERALRALTHADEVMCRSHGPHGRARTFHVAGAMLDLRAGKALSAKNEKLLNTAVAALSAADKQHAKAAKNHAAASDALNSVLATQDGKDGNQGAGAGGNPVAPQDGAGPRSAALRLRRQREAELRALRRL